MFTWVEVDNLFTWVEVEEVEVTVEQVDREEENGVALILRIFDNIIVQDDYYSS